MNCQEFRSRWLDETDSDQLAHIETCEACIAWMESEMVGDEEVQFLKEIPSPPANLEERIMQAIYQSTGQDAPPHAAATTRLSDAALSSSKRARSLPLAWAGAAAVLLVTGIIGYQQLQGPDAQTAMESSGAPQQTQPETASPLLTHDHSQAAAESAAGQEKSGSAESTVPAHPATAGEEAAPGGNQEVAALSEPAAEPSEPAAGSASEPQANNGSAAKGERPAIASRTTSPKPAAEPAAKPEEHPAVNEPLAPASQPAGSENQHAPGIAAAVVPKQSVFALTLAPDGEPETAQSASEAADANILIGPPAPNAKKAITLSTFLDVETAVQASDMPVPVLNKLPENFALSGISVRYESETSQKVVSLSANYVRGEDWIRVEVERNQGGKRSLSIPGTFTETQLFSVNNEQAIGVSYEQQPDQNHAAQHAVHFNAQSNGQSLYVVMTARGVSLDQLIDTAKQIAWRP